MGSRSTADTTAPDPTAEADARLLQEIDRMAQHPDEFTTEQMAACLKEAAAAIRWRDAEIRSARATLLEHDITTCMH